MGWNYFAIRMFFLGGSRFECRGRSYKTSAASRFDVDTYGCGYTRAETGLICKALRTGDDPRVAVCVC